MKRISITSVTFRANGPAQGTPFSHCHVEATARVNSDEKPTEVLAALRTFVIAELSISTVERRDIEKQVTLDRTIERKEQELAELISMRKSRQ
jgi:hypothetical protein